MKRCIEATEMTGKEVDEMSETLSLTNNKTFFLLRTLCKSIFMGILQKIVQNKNLSNYKENLHARHRKKISIN